MYDLYRVSPLIYLLFIHTITKYIRLITMGIYVSTRANATAFALCMWQANRITRTSWRPYFEVYLKMWIFSIMMIQREYHIIILAHFMFFHVNGCNRINRFLFYSIDREDPPIINCSGPFTFNDFNRRITCIVDTIDVVNVLEDYKQNSTN